MKGYAALVLVVALGTFGGVALVACAGRDAPPPQDISLCLLKMNAALNGASTCEAIVRAITSTVIDDPRCSELLLHGLQCTGPKDGG